MAQLKRLPKSKILSRDRVTMFNIPNKQENIAEYLLYMWQTEDILRAYELDIDQIQQNLIEPAHLSEEKNKEAHEWYEGLIMMMKSEGVQKEGHLQINKNIITDLTDLHLRLLNDPKEAAYMATYYKTLPFIVELRAKSNRKDIPETETCFTAVYGYLLLKLQKKEISHETQTAIDQIIRFLRLLSEKYKTIDQEEE